MPKADAASWLSALVLGKDAASAVALLDLSGTVRMVCTPALAALYDRALVPYAVQSAVLDGDAAALAGLVHIQAAMTLNGWR